MTVRTSGAIALASLLLSSCSGGWVTVADSRIESWALPVVPVAVDGASTLLSSGDRLYVLERRAGDDSLAVSALHRDGTRLWSTPLVAPPGLDGLEFTTETAGEMEGKWAMGFDGHTDYDDAIEAPLSFFARDGRLVLASYRVGENDSAYAIVRTLDAATGALRSSAVVARTGEERVASVGGAWFHSAVAPDSASMAISYAQPRDGDDRRDQRVVVVRTDGAIRRTVAWQGRPGRHPTPTVHPSRDGSLHFVTLSGPATLLVERSSPDGTVKGTEVRLGITSENPSARIGVGDYRVVAETDGSLVVAMLATIGREAVGVELVRIDEALTPTPLASLAIATSVLEREIDDDELGDCVIARLLRTDDAVARYLVVLESREAHDGAELRAGPVPPESTAGNALVLAFDERGTVRWQRGIAKSATDSYGGLWFLSAAAWRLVDGALETVFREGDVFAVRRFALADGRSLTTLGGHPIIGSHQGSGEYMRSIAWTGPRSLVVANGRSNPDRLMFVEYTLPAPAP